MANKRRFTMENLFGVLRGATIIRAKVSAIGRMPRVRGQVYFSNSGTTTIGNDFSVTSKPSPVSITVYKDAELTIGDNVFINYGVDMGVTHQVIIGNNVKIAPFVNIIDSNFHPVDPTEHIQSRPVIIEDNVWVGRQSTILPGVRIGKNSVVAALSVVTHDVPPNSVVAGTPARVVKTLDIPDGWIRP